MKRPPTFLSVSDVLQIHEDAIAKDGGLAGIRDPGLLDSAVMMPRQQFGGQFLHEDLSAMAAAYLFHIAKNHPFLDGNKRAAAMAAYVFLDANGMDLTASPDEFEHAVLSVASGTMSKLDLTSWMPSHVRKAQGG